MTIKDDHPGLEFDATVGDEVFERALEERWPTLLAQKSTIAHSPQSTIEPSWRGADTPGRRALSGLAIDGVPAITTGLTMGNTIGEGGMGIVRLATQLSLGRKVAVKTLKPDARGDGARLRLLREAWVTGSLEHPNIVPVYDLGVDGEGVPVIVLKKIEGVEWGALMRNPSHVRDHFGSTDILDWNLRILLQVSNAISLAHARGIVHRDLKPENVMIGEFGEVYVVDWGIAVSLSDDASGRIPLASDARDMAGTPAYMAPEMLGGVRPMITERTDVYLLGAILFEILAGHAPHQGATFRRIVFSIITGAQVVPPTAPAELVEICRRAMHVNARERFESAETLRFAIESYLSHAGSGQLAQEANARLDELRALLARDGESGGDDAAQRRARIYNLFGACRFGFRQALRSWPANEDAKAGLRAATALMTELEIARGSAENADAILSELDDPPAELVVRVKAALATHTQARSRAERLVRDHDPDIGRRTRLTLAIALGVVWTCGPLVALAFERGYGPLTYERTVVSTIALTAIAAGIAWWGRESLSKTMMNRRLVAIVVFAFAGQLAMDVGTHLLHLTHDVSQALHFFNYFGVTSMGALAIEKRLAASAVTYLGGFFVVCAQPEWRWWALCFCNLILTVNFLLAWGQRGLLKRPAVDSMPVSSARTR